MQIISFSSTDKNDGVETSYKLRIEVLWVQSISLTTRKRWAWGPVLSNQIGICIALLPCLSVSYCYFHVISNFHPHVQVVFESEKYARINFCRLSFSPIFYLDYAVHFLYRYKDKERDATMTILDIGLLTGFTVDRNDLNLVRALTNTRIPTYVSKVKKHDVFSDTWIFFSVCVCVCVVVQRTCPHNLKIWDEHTTVRKRLSHHLPGQGETSVSPSGICSLCRLPSLFSLPSLYASLQVSHTRPEEITFRIHQTFKVGVLQPAAVSVYEYYEREWR